MDYAVLQRKDLCRSSHGQSQDGINLKAVQLRDWLWVFPAFQLEAIGEYLKVARLQLVQLQKQGQAASKLERNPIISRQPILNTDVFQAKAATID